MRNAGLISSFNKLWLLLMDTEYIDQSGSSLLAGLLKVVEPTCADTSKFNPERFCVAA
jgi:hypothetical protein